MKHLKRLARGLVYLTLAAIFAVGIVVAVIYIVELFTHFLIAGVALIILLIIYGIGYLDEVDK